MTFWRKGRLALAKALGLKIRHSQDRYADLLSSSVLDRDRWLDIGCGRNIVPDWALSVEAQRRLVARARTLVGIDVDPAIFDHTLLTHKVIALANPMPFANEAFELITANMVMEHVERPEELIAEVMRVLTPGGRFIFHTPNLRFYLVLLTRFIPKAIKVKLLSLVEERIEPDIFVTHYRCNTVPRILELAARSGFEVRELIVGGSAGTFSGMGPIALLEIFVMKMLTLPRLSRFNTTIIAVLVKPGPVPLGHLGHL